MTSKYQGSSEVMNCSSTGTPPKFNSLPLKNGGWKVRSFPIGARSLLRGKLAVEFRENIERTMHRIHGNGIFTY